LISDLSSDATFVPLRPGLIINNPNRPLPQEQRKIFEANDWQIVDAAQPTDDRLRIKY
jgi:glycine amidinotransferase